MNHPTPEQWMEFLYAETAPARRTELQTHLAECPSCAARLAEWQAGKTALDQWPWPNAQPAPLRRKKAVPWAIAAALVIAASFAAGRFTSQQPALTKDALQKIRSELQTQVESQIAQRLEDRFQALPYDLQTASPAAPAADMAVLAREQHALNQSFQYLEHQRQKDFETLYNALLRLEENRLRDFSNLRRELETVAVFAESHFRKAELGLINLANYAAPEQPSLNPEP